MKRYVVISGASGGGKSTLLAELAARGHATVPEVGRRLLREEIARGGAALPWADPDAFLRRMIEASIADHATATGRDGPVFFDRLIVDAASGLEHRTGTPTLAALGTKHRYGPIVFLAPPWPEIYVRDFARRHGFRSAAAEYHRLARDYPALGYHVVHLPKAPVVSRVNFVLTSLGLG